MRFLFGGIGIYNKFGLRYSSPTGGSFFCAEDYIYFLVHFKELIAQPLKFRKIAKDGQYKPYPIGVLGDVVEIRFVHYKSEVEAAEKWARRCSRINFDKLYFIFSDHDGFNRQYLDRFAKLPFKNKIYLSARSLSEYGDLVVYVKDYSSKGQVDEYLIVNRVYEKYLDVVAWLNGEKNYLRQQA